jgi:hypothetical protein
VNKKEEVEMDLPCTQEASGSDKDDCFGLESPRYYKKRSSKTYPEENGGRRGLRPWENMVRNEAVGTESCMMEMLCGIPKIIIIIIIIIMVMLMTTTTTMMVNHMRAISFVVKPLT